MEDDLSVLKTYIRFIISSMTQFDNLLEKEKALLAKMSFLNKSRTIYSIWWSYDQYRNALRFEWEKIYQNTMHSYETQDNWELLSKNGTIYAKTAVQKFVEQFYYKLSVGVRTLVSAYDKKTAEKDKETDRLLFDAIFLEDIEKQMNKIFPFAMEVLNSPEAKADEKEAFIEENKKHNVDITQSLGFEETETPTVRNLIVTQKPKDNLEPTNVVGQLNPFFSDKSFFSGTSTSGISSITNPFFTASAPSQPEALEKSKEAEGIPAGSITGEIPTDDIRQYGKAYLLLLDEATRAQGYRMIEMLGPRLPEAGVALGQYYQSFDKEKAKKHFKVAADAGIAEGKWGYACLLEHSSNPDRNNPQDAEWEQYCLEAADAECKEAAHEMGNICHRRGAIVEAAYWYELSFSLGYNEALESVKGIVHEWIQRRCPELFIAGTKMFSEERFNASITYLKQFVRKIQLEEAKLSFDSMPERLLGYYVGRQYEFQKKDYDSSFDIYKKAMKTNYPFALDKYGKHVMLGKGVSKDFDGGISYIRKAAKRGCVQAMFSMGGFAVLEKDYLTAAYWYAQCYARGDLQSLQKLQELVDKL